MRIVALLPLLIVAACERPQPETPAPTPVDPAPVNPAPVDPPASPATTTIPAAFVGRYAGSAGDCGTTHEMELSIAPAALTFYESVGDVTAVRSAGDGSVEVDARFSGEGQTWTRTHRLTLDGARLTINGGDGPPVARVRCP